MQQLLISLAGFAIGVALMAILLASCTSYEGAGFSNSGAYKAPACVKYRKANREVWGTC